MSAGAGAAAWLVASRSRASREERQAAPFVAGSLVLAGGLPLSILLFVLTCREGCLD